MAQRRFRPTESGAVLVLALVFMVAASLMVIPLAGLATSNLGNTYNLGITRGQQTATDSIMDDAIEQVRYSTSQGYPKSSPPDTCSVTVPTLAEGSGAASYPIAVACQGYPLTANAGCTSSMLTWPGCAFTDSTASREVQFTATAGGSTVLQAVVEYWDFLPSCVSNCVQTGYATKIISWSVTPANS